MSAIVGWDNTDVVHGFVEKGDVLFVLDNLHRIEAGRLIEGARDSGQMATCLGILVASAQTIRSFGFGLGCVLICGSSSASTAVTSSATARRKICPIQRADE
jgi:hypothetical protein